MKSNKHFSLITAPLAVIDPNGYFVSAPLTIIPARPAVIPKLPAVIPAQAGIHKAVQTVTAHGFRLQATGMTECAKAGMTRWVKAGMARWTKTRMTRRALQQGFTLLEVILVLFLVGLMASATLMLTTNVEDQAKYDATKLRMEMMRKAIVGDPTRTVNGGPEISGFVADMGRLPLCVRELLAAQDCADPANGLTLWDLDASTGIGSGWRGPYIQVLPERNGALRFRDGYGNSDISTVIDAKNSGWITFDVSGAEISVISDSFSITDSADDIEANPLLVAADWQSNSINVNFINQNTSDALPTSAVAVVLRVYLSAADYADSSGSFTFNASNAAPANGGSRSKAFLFDASDGIPAIGQRGYALICFEIPSGSPDNYVMFDGGCSGAPPTLPDIKHFTIAPRQNITLDWIIQ